MKRWMKYVKPYLSYFILGPLGMIVEVVGEILMPLFLAMIIENAVSGGPLFSVGMAGAMIVTALLMMTGGIAGAYFGAKASVNFAADLRLDIYKKVQSFSFSNIDRFSSASLVTRLTNDVTQLQNMVNMLLRMCLRSPGMLIGALIMAITLRPSLAVVLAVTVPLLLLSIGCLILLSFPRFATMQKRVDGLNATVRENVTNVRVVKSFVREDREKEKFGKANKELKAGGLSAMKIMILMNPIMTFFMSATVMAVIWFGGGMALAGEMPIGDLSSFIVYCTQILSSLTMVTFLLMMLSRAMASAKRIREVLDETIDIRDSETADESLRATRGEIEFRDVSFRYYKSSEEKVLDGISFKIEAGETVGIIGSTGCGKTTLVSMIPRLYDPDCGEVLLDGRPVRDYTLYHLREAVGMVLQKNVLFSGSIGDNLRWGNENATDDELRAAATAAEADKFITSFKGGYDYDLGQGGSNVSGGQKQRLCIARALLKKPRVLILDDSTSAVDTATERKIRDAFRRELCDTTTIIIAQRIQSVRDADKIIVMNEGAVTGIGTHDELMKTNTEYQEIYYSQIDKDEKEGA